MGNLYYLILYLLGLSNQELIFIMENISNSDVKKIFTEERLEVEYKYNINLSKYELKLSNKTIIDNYIRKAEEIIRVSKQKDIKIITYKSRYYPKILKKIKNPPAIIYLKGKYILKADEKSIACVGSRNPTKSGIEAAKSLITNLVKEKFVIVSGLAYGVDKISHETCLKENGRTIAVVAHGLDMIYPKEHEDLAMRILENGGTIISEYPIGTKPDKFRFVDRNRIVSGLASGLLMIEAKAKSGTSHTVKFAKEQGRKVFFPTYTKETLENGLNFNLLKNDEATAINLKNDYHIIINKLGYKLKYDNNLINKLKNKALDKLMTPLKSSEQVINFEEPIDAKTGFGVNKEIYVKFKNILRENNLSVKEFFNAIIINIVKEYDKGEKK